MRAGAFTRLAWGTAVLGLLVGAAFPYFTDLLGVPPAYSRTSAFRGACVAAGLVLGAANWLLARQVIGRRVRALAQRLNDVAATAESATGAGQAPAASVRDLRLPITSADDLGATARAFNALLDALEGERRFRSVVRAASDAIAFVDDQGRVSFVSESVSEVLGWPPEAAVGALVADLVHRDDRAVVDGLLRGLAAGGRSSTTVRVRHADGGWRDLEVTTSDQRADPAIGALLLSGRDVTEQLQLQRRLSHRAHHDDLTGLPNRAALLAAGAAALSGLRPGESLAVVLMDLDRFKEVNDTLGHAAGDRLLAQVGPRLAPLVREVDVLARLGGDEFAVLLPGVSPAGARAAAERLRRALVEPFVLDDLALDVEASCGVAVSVGPGPHDIHALLRQADIAMYAAKELQRGVQLYDPAKDTHDRSRLVLLSEFRRAIAEGQLVVHYQPKVALPGGDVVGVEALVRWQHPTRGLLAPGHFLAVVEQTSLIEPLTAAVLDQALAQVRAWADAGLELPVAVNVSARSLHHADLPDRVLDRLRAHGVPAAMLRLEITESALMAEPQRAREVLARLHAAGVRLSIDDFGTGYTSMGHLQRLPVDELKVDRSFVTDMTTSPEDAVLVRSVVDLGHHLGLTVVAEGVEEASTVEALTALGCDVAQGYLFARPQPAAEITARYAPVQQPTLAP